MADGGVVCHEECAICLGKFDQPKILPCFHTFCLECLRKYVEEKLTRGKIKCPLCRCDVHVPAGGVQNFQSNFYIEYRSGDQKGTRALCKTCTFNLPVQFRCLDCNEHFCKVCNDSHRKMKITKNHRFVEILDSHGGHSPIRRDVHCVLHPDKNVEFFCRRCRLIICSSCKLTKHEGHLSEVLTETVADLRLSIGGVLASRVIGNKWDSISSSKTRISGMRAQLASTRQQIITKIRERSAELIRDINEKCEQLINTVDTTWQKDVDDLDTADENLKRTSMSFRTLCNTAKQMLAMADDVEIIERGDYLVEALNDVIEKDVTREPVCQLPALCFVPGGAHQLDMADIFGYFRVGREEHAEQTDETELKLRVGRKEQAEQTDETELKLRVGREEQAKQTDETELKLEDDFFREEVTTLRRRTDPGLDHNLPQLIAVGCSGRLRLKRSFSVGGEYGISGLCPARNGACWVTNCTPTIRLVDSKGKEVGSVTAGKQGQGCGMAIDNDDVVHVTFYCEKSIYKLSGDGQLSSYTVLPFPPRGLTVDHTTGNMLVCGGKGRGVVSVTTGGQWAYQSPPDVKFQGARDIATSCHGYIGVTDPRQKKVFIFFPGKRQTAVFTGQDPTFRPRGICCDIHGNFLLTDSDDNKINIINHNGELLATYSTANDCRGRPYSVAVDNSGYLWSPTNPNVVLASVDYFISLSHHLGQAVAVVTCDQAIYGTCIVKEITFKYPDKYSNLVVRLGGFYIAENFFGAIGHFMKNSGIEDILVESNLCLRGTANKIVVSKDYYKMVRHHSLLCEAMLGLLWKTFFDWYGDQDDQDNDLIILYVHLDIFKNFFGRDAPKALICANIQTIEDDLIILKPSRDAFVEQLGVTGQYWFMYIVMVMIAKRYIHAERAGDWMEHLIEIQNKLPYLVSAGHTNYISCLPLYLKDMKELPTKHPEVHASFMDGKFTVRETNGKFNGVWTDLALEQTYNKEGKSAFFKGISQIDAVRDKYISTAPVLTNVSESVKSMVHLKNEGSGHHAESLKQSSVEVAMVEKIQDVITNMMDPFICDNKCDLLNIATSEKAQSTIKRQAKRQDAFSYEWTAYPASLFTPNDQIESGFAMRKENKSDFLAALLGKIDGSVTTVSSLPESSFSTVYLIDAMAFMQKYQTLKGERCEDLPRQYISTILQLKPEQCDCINIVGDRYDFSPAESLKGHER
ncbi:hypothetical protein ScPMuIL_004563 [Solemya velum]